MPWCQWVRTRISSGPPLACRGAVATKAPNVMKVMKVMNVTKVTKVTKVTNVAK